MGIRFPLNHLEMEPFSMCRIAIDLINSAYYCISSGWTSVGEATTMLKTVKFVGIRGNLSIIIIPQGACPRGVFVDPLKRFACRDSRVPAEQRRLGQNRTARSYLPCARPAGRGRADD